MIESPKSLFQQAHKDAAEALSVMSRERVLRLATVFAISEMASTGATKEQMDGALRYSHILMNLGEPIEKAVTYPTKQVNL
jgi:hypothetical protein